MINLLFLLFIVISVCVVVREYHAEFRMLMWKDLVFIGSALLGLLVGLALVLKVAAVGYGVWQVSPFWQDVTGFFVIVVLFYPTATALYQFAWKRAALRKKQFILNK